MAALLHSLKPLPDRRKCCWFVAAPGLFASESKRLLAGSKVRGPHLTTAGGSQGQCDSLFILSEVTHEVRSWRVASELLR